MGLATFAPEVDQSRRVEALCRAASSNIDNFFLEELYRAEVNNNEELITPMFLRNCALRLLIQELQALGIEFFDINELLEDDYHALVLIRLRVKFDKDSFAALLRAMGQNVQELMRYYATTDIADDVINNIVRYFQMGFPTDVVWSMLDYYSDTFYSTPRFLDHVLAILDSIQADPQEDQSSDVIVADYAKSAYEHIYQVQTAIRTMLVHAADVFMQVDFETVMTDMRTHDAYLKDATTLREMALKTAKGQQIYQQHCLTARHHIEWEGYYDNRQIVNPEASFTPTNLVLLLGNSYVAGDRHKFEERVTEFKTVLKNYPEIVGMLDKLADIVRKELYQ